MSKPFKFKQFSVHQDRAAMKIGTDGVLLGAWASLKHKPESILDIGTGTGVIALMMAQRSDATLIDALELDDAAYEQAVDNFERSDWGDRLFCYHASLEEFAQEAVMASLDETEESISYDLIICNPPFYTDSHTSGNSQRDLARSAAGLPFHDLLDGVSNLLSNDGEFAVIVPGTEEFSFAEIASDFGLYPNRITRIKGNPDTPEKRSLMQFGYNEQVYHQDVLVIENGRHNYTPEYIALTKDFYLKM